jgi:hypothetical protein
MAAYRENFTFYRQIHSENDCNIIQSRIVSSRLLSIETKIEIYGKEILL